MPDTESATGIIKFFRRNDGYGFIVPDPPMERDVFFHITSINGFPYVKVLPPNAKVIFEWYAHEKGPRAEKVSLR